MKTPPFANLGAELSYAYHVLVLRWKPYGVWRNMDGSTKPCMINPAGECVEHLPKLPTTRRNAVLAIFNVTQSNP